MSLNSVEHPSVTIGELRNRRAAVKMNMRAWERDFEHEHGWRPGPADKREDGDYARLKRELKRIDAALRLVRGVHDDGAGKRAALRDFTMQSRRSVDGSQRGRRPAQYGAGRLANARGDGARDASASASAAPAAPAAPIAAAAAAAAVTTAIPYDAASSLSIDPDTRAVTLEDPPSAAGGGGVGPLVAPPPPVRTPSSDESAGEAASDATPTAEQPAPQPSLSAASEESTREVGRAATATTPSGWHSSEGGDDSASVTGASPLPPRPGLTASSAKRGPGYAAHHAPPGHATRAAVASTRGHGQPRGWRSRRRAAVAAALGTLLCPLRWSHARHARPAAPRGIGRAPIRV